MARVLMYAGFERFWHWSQALLVLLMLVTGFEIHGTIRLLGFDRAVDLHGMGAWTLIGLWAFAWFWHLTTGEWRQYIPATSERILAMIRYYVVGIFQGRPHPFHKDLRAKHNPLQRLVYLMLHLLVGPAIWISGLLYLFYNNWGSLGLGWMPLEAVALVHTAAAFLMLAFLIAHLYLGLTTGTAPFASLKAMITGYEEVEEGHGTRSRVA